MERMGSWMKESGMREQIAAAFTDESGGWSVACEIQREEWQFVEAGAPPVQIYTNKETPLWLWFERLFVTGTFFVNW